MLKIVAIIVLLDLGVAAFLYLLAIMVGIL